MYDRTTNVQEYLNETGYNLVKVLNLQKQNLSDVENTYNKCKNLIFLFLQGNHISSVSSISFNFSQLIFLDLTNNFVNTLGYKYFWEQLSNLQVLILKQNKLSNNNFLSDFQNIKYIKNLFYLDLSQNEFDVDFSYLTNIIKIFPNLSVLDCQIISRCQVIDQTMNDNYQNSEYFQRRKKFSLYYKTDQISLNVNQNITNLIYDLQKFQFMQSIACPILIIQKYFKKFKVEQYKFQRQNQYLDCILKIQSILKMLYSQKKFQKVIKVVAIYQRKQKLIKTIAFSYLIQRCCEHSRARALICRSQACITIVNSIRKLIEHKNYVKQENEFQQFQQNDKYQFLVCKPYTREQDIIKFIYNFLSRVAEVLKQKLEFMNITDCASFIKQNVSYKTTDYQFSSRNGLQIVLLKRCYKGYDKQSQFKPQINRNYSKLSLKIGKNVQSTTNHLQNSVYQNLKRNLQNLHILKPGFNEYHNFYENSEYPFAVAITVHHKYLAPIVRYLVESDSYPVYDKNNNLIGYDNGQTDGLKPITVLQRNISKQYLLQHQDSFIVQNIKSYEGKELGEYIMNKVFDQQLQQTIFMMFKSGCVPYLFSSATHLIRQSDTLLQTWQEKAYFSSTAQVQIKDSCYKIQKIYRQLKSNKILIQDYNQLINKYIDSSSKINAQFYSIYQIYIYVYSIKSMQMYIRGYIYRKQHLIEQKMMDSFKSAALHGVVLIPKIVMNKILNKQLNDYYLMRKHHVNISQIVNQKYSMNIFRVDENKQKNIDQEIIKNISRVAQIAQQHSQIDKQTQFILLQGKVEGLSTAFQGRIFGIYQKFHNGVAQLDPTALNYQNMHNSRCSNKKVQYLKYFQPDQLKHCINYYDKDLFTNLIGVDIASQIKDQTVLISNNPLKTICATNTSKYDFATSEMLQHFDVKVNNKLQSSQEFLANFMINLHIHEFDSQLLFPIEFQKIATQQFTDYYVLKEMNVENSQQYQIHQQLAIKMLALELRFYNPQMLYQQQLNYRQRLLQNLQDTQNCISFSYQQSLLLVAIIILQTFTRKYIAFNNYQTQSKKSTMLNKLNKINAKRNGADCCYAELQTIQKLNQMQQYYRSSSAPTYVQQTNTYLQIKTPELNIQTKNSIILHKRLNNLKQQFQQQIYQFTLGSKAQTELKHKQLYNQAIKENLNQEKKFRHQSAFCYSVSRKANTYNNILKTVTKIQCQHQNVQKIFNVNYEEQVKVQLVQDQQVFLPTKIIGDDDEQISFNNQQLKSNSNKTLYNFGRVQSANNKLKQNQNSLFSFQKQPIRDTTKSTNLVNNHIKISTPNKNKVNQLNIQDNNLSKTTIRTQSARSVQIQIPIAQINHIKSMQHQITTNTQQVKQQLLEEKQNETLKLKMQLQNNKQQVIQKKAQQLLNNQIQIQNTKHHLQKTIQKQKTILNTNSVLKNAISQQ